MNKIELVVARARLFVEKANPPNERVRAVFVNDVIAVIELVNHFISAQSAARKKKNNSGIAIKRHERKYDFD